MTPRVSPGGASPNWANRTMWTGDNLHMMRGTNSKSVDPTYPDPPLNSNRNYSAPIWPEAAGAAFKDTWTPDYLDIAEHGYLPDSKPKLHANNRRRSPRPQQVHDVAYGSTTYLGQ